MIDKKEGNKGYTESNSEQFFCEMLSSVTEAVLAFGQSSTPPGELIITASGFMLRQELNTRLRRQAARLGVSLESLCHLGWALVLSRSSHCEQVVVWHRTAGAGGGAG